MPVRPVPVSSSSPADWFSELADPRAMDMITDAEFEAGKGQGLERLGE